MEENDLASMLAAKWLAGLVSEVDLMEHVTHMPQPSTVALKLITRSPNSGISTPPFQRTYVLQIFVKNIYLISQLSILFAKSQLY